VDLSSFTKGIIWVNGHNLGRYWNIGPQKRLFCPSNWLRAGQNEIMIFDLHNTESQWVSGFKSLEGTNPE
jgi:beta-galactosidase GanA